MRDKLAAGLLTVSVIVWGIWCGGQGFNELMTVPIWSAAPPESLKVHAELPRKGGAPFFPLFGPLFAVLAIGAALAAWKSARRSRKWLVLSAFIAIAVSISLMYLAPLVGSMFRHSMARDLPASDIVAGGGGGEIWDKGRVFFFVFLFVLFVFFFLGLG